MQSRGRVECLHREKECLHEYTSISKDEEAFFKQKSRNNWLNLGDQNTSYFHNLVKVRNSNNTINQLWDDQGLRVVEVDQIKNVTVEYYRRLLGSSMHEFNAGKAIQVNSLLFKKVSEDQSRVLEKGVSEMEIGDTLFTMKSSKAPGT